MKGAGYIVIALGLTSISVLITIAWVGYLVGGLKETYWLTIEPYLQGFAVPFILSLACIVMGIVMMTRSDKSEK